VVKIRLRRIGSKGRPFYRVVVAPSSAGRNGRFVETLGTYNPISNPKQIQINEERALYWLNHGAQPTETTAYLLNKMGILPKYLEEHPEAKKQYKFLDKRTAAISKASAVTTVAPATEAPSKAKAEEPKAEEPKAEAAVEEAAAPEAAADEPAVQSDTVTQSETAPEVPTGE
jgi:small subunit ribosomal protein S16